MRLQTQIPLTSAKNQIDYQSQLLLVGSCFVENIGEKLNYFKFRSTQNPYGILFHPQAIENLVAMAIEGKTYSEEAVFFLNERWHCFGAHSDLSDISKDNLLIKLNNGLEQTHQQITISTHIIITLGTAWAYRYKETNNLVANCHKVPQDRFVKELLSVEAISASLERTINLIKSLNPKAVIIFTVSPVRHLKDGFIENQRSKAHLITAVHQILHKEQEVCYFPSYEIMMDELRDYRFYAEDMVHPNGLAIDYIWEKFKEVWISKKAYPVMEQVEAVQKGLSHRPFNPNSIQHQEFLSLLRQKIMHLQREFPFMEF